MCGKLTFLSAILILTGIISFGTITSLGVKVYHNFQDYKCGNLNYGILVGLVSMIILILNMLLYCIKCVKKISLLIPSICVIGSLIYNIYLLNKMGEICNSYYEYENNKLWEYYIFYLISLLVNIIFIAGVLIYTCCKSNHIV